MNREIRFSNTKIIYASKESTWKVLLSDQLYQTAWGATLETSWKPGASIHFNGVWENVPYTDKGVVEINREYSFLKYTYWSTFWNVADTPDEYCTIFYAIDGLDNLSCELTITQDGFRDEKHYTDTVDLWNNTLDLIKIESEKIDLTAANNNTFNILTSMIDSIPEGSYNKRVASRWNIAQIVEHIIIGNSDMKQFITDATPNPSTPDDFHINNIRTMMNNNEDKLKSPSFLMPALKTYDKEQHKELLLKIQNEINECINAFDLTKTCNSYEMPPFGYMSIFEWLNFCVFHISRHTRQIESLLYPNDAYRQ